MYSGLVTAVLSIHVLWILWVLLGWLVTRGRPILTAIHLAALAWGIMVELGPWPCPLTLLEQWLEAGSGAAAYQQSFIAHYMDKLVYPDLPAAVLSWGGAAVCGVILGVYGRRLAQWAKRA